MATTTKHPVLWTVAIALAIYLLWFRKRADAVVLPFVPVRGIDYDTGDKEPLPDTTTTGVSYYTIQGAALGSWVDAASILNLADESKAMLNTYQPYGMPLYDQFSEIYYKGGDTTEVVAQINGAIHDYLVSTHRIDP